MELCNELWIKVLGDAIGRKSLDQRDLCVISMVCRSFREVSRRQEIWKLLWDNEDANFKDDAAPLQERDEDIDWKTKYRTRFERMKREKQMSHLRRRLRAESRVAVLNMECNDLEMKMKLEQLKLARTRAELKRIEHASRVSASLNIWQPQAVRTRNEQIIAQQPQNVSFYTQSLEMEAKVCNELLQRYSRSLNNKRILLEKARLEVEFLTYNPLPENQHNSRKRKRCKPTHVDC